MSEIDVLVESTAEPVANAMAEPVAIAHPEFRDELLGAAERASRGRSPVG